jgi:hypothetical protein
VKDVKDIENHDKIVQQLVVLAARKNCVDFQMIKDLHRSLFPEDGGQFKSDINLTHTRYEVRRDSFAD